MVDDDDDEEDRYQNAQQHNNHLVALNLVIVSLSASPSVSGVVETEQNEMKETPIKLYFPQLTARRRQRSHLLLIIPMKRDKLIICVLIKGGNSINICDFSKERGICLYSSRVQENKWNTWEMERIS